MTQFPNTTVTITPRSQIYSVFKTWIEVWQPINKIVGRNNYNLYGFDLLHKQRFIIDVVDVVDTFGSLQMHKVSVDEFTKLVTLQSQVIRSIEAAKQVHSWGCGIDGVLDGQRLMQYIEDNCRNLKIPRNDEPCVKLSDPISQHKRNMQPSEYKMIPVFDQHDRNNNVPSPPAPPPKRYKTEGEPPQGFYDEHPIIMWIDKHLHKISAVVAIVVLVAVLFGAR